MTALYIHARIHPSTISSPFTLLQLMILEDWALARIKHRHQLNQSILVMYGD